MKYLMLIVAVGLIGITAAGCTEDSSYSGRSQYGYNNDRNRDGIPDNRQRDTDSDDVPNSRDRAPNNPYYR